MTMGLHQLTNDPQRMRDALDVAGLIRLRLQEMSQRSSMEKSVPLHLAVLLLGCGLGDAMNRSKLNVDEALLVCACLEQARGPRIA